MTCPGYGDSLSTSLPDAVPGSFGGGASPPEPRLLTQDLGQGARSLRLWFWVDTRSHDPLRVRSELLDAVERRLRDAGIELGLPAAAD